MKTKIFLIIILFALSLVGCQQQNNDDNISSDFFVGVIETTQAKEDSSITFYDESLNELGTKYYDYADLSSTWDNPVYLDNSVLLVPLGLMKKADAKKVVSLNVENQEFTEYPIDRVNILCSTADEKYVYAGSNLNGECYITRFDKTTKEIKEVKLEEAGAMNTQLVVDKDKLYEFYNYSIEKNGELIDHNGIHIYNDNLELFETIDLSEYCGGVYKAMIYNNKMFIPSQFKRNGEDDDQLLILDLVSYDIKTVTLPYKTPDDVFEYKGSLIISHTSILEPNGSMVSVYNLETEQIRSYDLKCTIRKTDINNNTLIVLTAEDKLITYDIDNNFKKNNEIQLEYQSKNTYKSNIFVNHQE
ncbi:hypothetical protein EDD63_1357 [Breznakia blatticola]|uniref:Lipoprotein n=1 Tax=Breznakia blatticola TaxID=1754012 RepID=A0A4R7ZBW7_9FIRM|nr:hypothetical protein [Breznakia blatticola]TDW14662.1 hypothetical protein EDD63_1357 [Breznakia blatticola]